MLVVGAIILIVMTAFMSQDGQMTSSREVVVESSSYQILMEEEKQTAILERIAVAAESR